MTGNNAVQQGVGGGVAPGRFGRRQSSTEVRYSPRWVAWDAGGAGSWRLVPSDKTHRHDVRDTETGEVSDYYEWKGFLRERDAPPETIPALIVMAAAARDHAASLQLVTPDWAVDVLNRHGEPQPPKTLRGK